MKYALARFSIYLKMVYQMYLNLKIMPTRKIFFMQSKMFACLSSPLKNLRTFLSVSLVESVGNIFASIPLLKYSKNVVAIL